MKRAGMFMVLCGLLGALFFVATDPRISPSWVAQMGWKSNLIDATFDATAGTLIGLAGSVVVIVIGTWLLLRRSI
jgi:hypothetical protein